MPITIDGIEYDLLSLTDVQEEITGHVLRAAWRSHASRLGTKDNPILVTEPVHWSEEMPRAGRYARFDIDPDAELSSELLDVLAFQCDDGTYRVNDEPVSTLRQYLEAGRDMPVAFREDVTQCDACAGAFRTNGRATCDPCIEDAHEDALIEDGRTLGYPGDEAVLALLDYEDSLDEDVLIFDPAWYESEEDIEIPAVRARAR